jgi:hypothetical protein
MPTAPLPLVRAVLRVYINAMDLASSVIVVSTGPSDWIAITVAILAFIASIIATVFASRSARSNKELELQANRLAELESRNSERKYEIYKPMIDWSGQAFGNAKPGTSDEMAKLHADFATWVSIYGSDEVVTAYHNFRQVAFRAAASRDVPGLIAVRTWVDFVLAVRRDLGYPDSKIDACEILGLRIDDLYTTENLKMTLSLDELCKLENWVPPWVAPKEPNQSAVITVDESALPPPS